MREAAVRRLSVPLVAALAIVIGVGVGVAGAAGIDSKALVLQPSDVPAGFRLDRDPHATRYVPSAAIARADPRFWKRVAGSGRISGYAATYEKGAATILSAAHLFRKGRGAHVFYAAQDTDQRSLNAERVKRGGRAYRHEVLLLGDEASLYRSTQAPKFTIVVWRTGRVVGNLSTWGLGRDRTVALARVQQRRIEKTLG